MENKLDGASLDIERMEQEKLRAVFPQCFVEGKLDIDKLLSMCGEYIDNDFEKYKFEWKGKAESLRLAQQRSMGTLRPCPAESVDWDTTQNLYIEGDNLEVLKLLQTAYYRRVKMIYIDPPYNTGNDFVYADDFKDPIQKYKEVTAQTTRSNPETMGRFHTNWLNMMYPRLRLASKLLRDDGVIFISIDDNEMHNLRKLCDEVFGEENFVAQISVLNNPKGRSQDKYIATCHEFLFCYSKTTLSKGAVSIEKSEDEIGKDYSLSDDRGLYRELELRNTHREFGKHNRPNLFYPFYVDDNGNVSINSSPGATPIYPIWDDGFEGCWTWGQKKAEDEAELISARKVNGSWKIYRKAYAVQGDDTVTKQVKSIWTDSRFHTEKGQVVFNELFQTKEKIFQSPKSVELLKELIKMSGAEDGDIILDFFSGSATTAHAVMQLNKEDGGNRKFIMVQLPELTDEKSEAYKAGYKNICEIGKERIRRAGAKIKDEWKAETAKRGETLFGEDETRPTPPDTGFKVLKLDTSNLKIWDASLVDGDDPQQLELLLDRMNDMVETIKADRTDMDVVYEIMLKMGVPPTYSVTPVEVDGWRAYCIGKECLLMVCLQEGLTAAAIERMAEEHLPSKMILSEKCFADDTAMANAHYILKERNIELKLV